MTMEASFRALDAFISPSAAMTWDEAKGEVKWEKVHVVSRGHPDKGKADFTGCTQLS